MSLSTATMPEEQVVMMPMVSGLALPIPVPPVTGGFPYGAPIPGVSMVAPGVPGAVPGLSFAGAPGYPGLPGMQPAPFGLQPFAGARTLNVDARAQGDGGRGARGRARVGAGARAGDGGRALANPCFAHQRARRKPAHGQPADPFPVVLSFFFFSLKPQFRWR